MVRTAVIASIAAVVLLSGCGDHPSIEELKDRRDECVEAGGRFEQWRGGYGNENTRCDFGEVETP